MFVELDYFFGILYWGFLWGRDCLFSENVKGGDIFFKVGEYVKVLDEFCVFSCGLVDNCSVWWVLVFGFSV